MIRIAFLFFCLGNGLVSLAQYRQAYLDENGLVKVKTVPAPQIPVARSENNVFGQMDGFPKAFLADKTNKNFRNVALADLNGDGTEEIITAIRHKLYGFSKDQLLFEHDLTGLALYPPSVGDIDNDGQLDIVLATGGVQQTGRLYAFNSAGEVLPGWPVSLNDNWVLTAPTLVDLDDDGPMEIIANELANPGRVHILKADGSPFSNNWPVTLDRTPAVTPTVGDIDNDGKKDIIIHSTRTMYAFDLNGRIKEGWPVVNPDTWFSFQSPILVDLDGDNLLELFGATHGDAPEYYVVNHQGQYLEGWPIKIKDDSWTFSPVTVVAIDNGYHLFSSRPIFGDTPDEVVYSWDETGQLRQGYPIVKTGGLESQICVADVDNDGQFEIVFGSNLVDEAGNGFIHAYELDGSTEVTGFPIQPKGFSYMNGANLGDVNGDGLLDLVSLSYSGFGAGDDTTYLNVYELGIPFTDDQLLWTTYKGSNTRSGVAPSRFSTGVFNPAEVSSTQISIIPNPIQNDIQIQFASPFGQVIRLEIFDILGRLVLGPEQHIIPEGKHQLILSSEGFERGIYILKMEDEARAISTACFLKME